MITICNNCGHRSETIRAGFTCGSDIMAKRPYGAEQCGGQMQPQSVNVGDVWEILGERWRLTAILDSNSHVFAISAGGDPPAWSAIEVPPEWLQALGERIEP